MSERDKIDLRVGKWVLLGCSEALSRAQKSGFPCSMLFGPSPERDRFTRTVMGHYPLEDEAYIARQLAEIRQYLEDRDWELAHTYSDNGYSGNSSQRPGLLRLRQDIRDGRADVVVVCDLARLFRGFAGLRCFVQLIQEHQVELICLR